MTFDAWDTVTRELEDASKAAQAEADWPRHRDITEALRLLHKIWMARTFVDQSD